MQLETLRFEMNSRNLPVSIKIGIAIFKIFSGEVDL